MFWYLLKEWSGFLLFVLCLVALMAVAHHSRPGRRP